MKIFIRMATVLLLFSALFLFSACADEATPVCTHQNQTGWIIDKEATCMAKGTRHKECSDCGKWLLTETYSVGHQYQDGICIFCGAAKYGDENLQFTAVTVNGTEGYAVTGRGNCYSLKPEIPATHNNKPVLAIGARAFCEMTTITAVRIPTSVVVIGDGAFSGCNLLESVTFDAGSHCVSIGQSAFSGCTALREFHLPAGVTVVSDELFKGNCNLGNVVLHENVVAVEGGAFDECDSLICTESNGLRYIGYKENPYFLLLGVTKENRSATAITPDVNMKIVGAGALSGLVLLETVTLPTGTISLEEGALSGCVKLTEITLPEGISRLGDNVFSGCADLSALVLPSTLKSIGNSCFSNCGKLASVPLPDGLTAVGSLLFYQCPLLTFTEEGGLCYFGSLTNAHFLLYKATDTGRTSYTVHADTKILAGGCLGSCSALETVALPQNLRAIGISAFPPNSSLQSLSLSGSWATNIRPMLTDAEDMDTSNAATNAQNITRDYLLFYWLKK